MRRAADSYGVLHPGQGQWSTEEWVQWLNSRPLSEDVMQEAVKAWQYEFISEELQHIHRWEELRRLGTRESKKEAHEIVNGAWEVHLAKCDGGHQC